MLTFRLICFDHDSDPCAPSASPPLAELLRRIQLGIQHGFPHFRDFNGLLIALKLEVDRIEKNRADVLRKLKV
jgi:hypothetical protein